MVLFLEEKGTLSSSHRDFHLHSPLSLTQPTSPCTNLRAVHSVLAVGPAPVPCVSCWGLYEPGDLAPGPSVPCSNSLWMLEGQGPPTRVPSKSSIPPELGRPPHSSLAPPLGVPFLHPFPWHNPTELLSVGSKKQKVAISCQGSEKEILTAVSPVLLTNSSYDMNS